MCTYDAINFERKLTAWEHVYLLFSDSKSFEDYEQFRITEELINRYNQLNVEDRKDIVDRAHNDKAACTFVSNFNAAPWEYEKTVLWSDRKKTPNFINKLEKSHRFEVYIENEFRLKGVDINLYYSKELQYSGENDAGIEIKYDIKHDETGNYFIEYAERMRDTQEWVRSGILKDDNSNYFLCGTFNGYSIFRKTDLIDIYKRLKRGENVDGAFITRESEYHTGRGFVIKPVLYNTIAMNIDEIIRELPDSLHINA